MITVKQSSTSAIKPSNGVLKGTFVQMWIFWAAAVLTGVFAMGMVVVALDGSGQLDVKFHLTAAD
jgi:hypothetical protein